MPGLLHSPVPGGIAPGSISSVTEKYMADFEVLQKREGSNAKVSSSMTTKFYDMVTDFYEYGWGQCFHFAPRLFGESFREALKRHEHFLALKLKLAPGVSCLDLGCGVGGPLVEIAGFSGASITGININKYQVKKVQENIARHGLASTCNCVESDFMTLPFPDNSKDRVYQIEATCHASDRVGCYREAHRVLKEGGLFAGYEWVTTPQYNPDNAEHRKILEGIEVGNGLPPTLSSKQIIQSLEDAGFEVVESLDMTTVAHFPTPWYEPLAGGYTISGFRYTRPGRTLTHKLVSLAERAKLVPQGTTDISSLLMMTAEALVAGGEKGIFSPSFYYLARKKTTTKGGEAAAQKTAAEEPKKEVAPVKATPNAAEAAAEAEEKDSSSVEEEGESSGTSPAPQAKKGKKGGKGGKGKQ